MSQTKIRGVIILKNTNVQLRISMSVLSRTLCKTCWHHFVDRLPTIMSYTPKQISNRKTKWRSNPVTVFSETSLWWKFWSGGCNSSRCLLTRFDKMVSTKSFATSHSHCLESKWLRILFKYFNQHVRLTHNIYIILLNWFRLLNNDSQA